MSRRALGAIAAQFSQALSSFLLTVLAARSLDAATFGRLALLLGSTIVATAVMTGVVGDSLTVLDRHDPGVRAGLQVCCAGLALLVFAAGAGLTGLLGLLEPGPAALFGSALSVFTLEDTVRRLLMATMRFWCVVLVDTAYIGVAGCYLLLAVHLNTRLVLQDFILAILIGQAAAIVVGLAVLPGCERSVAAWHGALVRDVLAFGGWRALQQTIRPGALTLVRVLVVSTLGAAVLGQLEVARLYMSPALLLVQGTGGFLLANYAANRGQSLRSAARGADRAAALLVLCSTTVGVLAVAALPVLGPVVAGSTDVGRVAVLGWIAYSASIAATMPFASLAAVRGRQVVVVALRLFDTVVGLLLVMLALRWRADAALVPVALGVGGFFGAGLQRWAVTRQANSGLPGYRTRRAQRRPAAPGAAR